MSVAAGRGAGEGADLMGGASAAGEEGAEGGAGSGHFDDYDGVDGIEFLWLKQG